MRSVFGWSLPPGCTSRMIDEAMGVDEPCAVCAMDPADCICVECPTCGEQGNPKCYRQRTIDGHGLMLSKEQVISRQKAYIRMLENRVDEEKMVLDSLENSPVQQWDITDVVDPWGG